MKHLFTFILGVLILGINYAQCPKGSPHFPFSSQYYDASTLAPGVRTELSTAISLGKYFTITNLVSSETYRIDLCEQDNGAGIFYANSMYNTSLTIYEAGTNNIIGFNEDFCGDDASIDIVIPAGVTAIDIQINAIINGQGCSSMGFTDTALHITLLSSSCTDPDVPNITTTTPSICPGNNATLDWTGANLNDATEWYIYTNGCGSGLLTSQAGTTLMVSPTSTTTYYIRGEDGSGCVDESQGLCGTITITVSDATAPTIICPGSQSTCSTTLPDFTGMATTTDNCDTSPVITQLPAAGSATTIGTMTIVLTSTDAEGNSSDCSFTLTVVPEYNETATATICGGDNYTFGTQTLTTAGSYTEIFTSINGCDSTVVLTLTENPIYNEAYSASFCSGTSYSFGTQSLSTAGTYTEVFQSVNGCDSTVVLTLTELPSYNETISASFCAGDNYTFGTQTLTAAGTYTEVFQSVNGCDSTVVLTLTELPSYNETISASFCAGDNYTFGTQTLTTAGTYTEVFQSVNGCDSTVVLTLTELPSYNETISASFCAGDNYTFGTQTLTAAGTYTEVFQSVNGCDSIVNLILTTEAVNLNITQDGPELTADNANGTYQWVDCDNGFAPIAGETNQMYTATNNGNYAVIITEAGCTDTSACYNVNNVSIISNEFGKHITMYPNPANELVTVELGDDIQDINIQMYDVSGQLVYTQNNISDHKTMIDISQFERGIYLVEFSYGDDREVIRLTVQ